MFELCVRWFAWGLDTSLKAVLVAVVAACVLKLLRLQDSNVRHRVWTGVLVGMFLLPVLTPLVPTLRLPLMPSPDWLVAWSEEPASPEAATSPGPEVPIADTSVPLLAPLATQEPELDQPLADRSLLQSGGVSSLEPDFPPTIIRGQFRSSQIEPVAEPQSLAPLPSPPPPSGPSRRAIAIAVVFLITGVWLSVSTLLLARLAIGLWLAARLRRSSLAIDPVVLGAASTTTPRVRESAGIHIPLTIGCLQPLILLPTSWRQWPTDKLHAVLAHEQMHVQRGDCVVALLAEINCCLYWFHPLASWLKAHLSALAEQACDDAAIHSIGDRARYARHLLEVAADVSRHRGRLVPVGLSMARRSNVEQRILSILDFTRPLSHRLTWTKALFVLSVMVPLIALAAALQPFSRPPSNEESPAAETNALDDGPKRPIMGRLIDSEGRPIASATIKVSTVISPKPGDTLDKLLQAWKQGRHNVREVGIADNIAQYRLPEAQTDSEGRFTLPAVSLERMYVLEINGNGIAASMLWVANREGVDVAPYIEARPVYFRQMDPPLLGPDFTHVILPDFKLTGRVTDDNGQPLAGVDVSAVLEMQSHKSVFTDADGRYELAGLPRDQEVMVCYHPRDEQMLGRTVAPKAQIDEATKVIDVTLKRGILVSGRITDAQTGKGVEGGIRYVPLPENEYARQPGYDTFDRDGSTRRVDNDGCFSFLVIPGPGVLIAQAWGDNIGPKFGDEQLSQYRVARFSAEDQPRVKPFENDSQRFVTAGESIQSLDGFHAAKYVNFAPGSPPPSQNLMFDRGQTLKVDFVDAAGQPVNDVFVAGIVETWPITAQLSKSRETIYALGPDRPRKVFALQAKRNLAGVALLTGNEKSPYRFTLDQAATLRGRAVDEGGAPLANQDLGVFFANGQKDQISELYRFFPGQKTTLTTDQGGRFQMKCLVPGEQFYLTYWRGNHHFVGRLTKAQQTAQPAQTLDLGNVIFAPDTSINTSAEEENSAAESDEKVAAKRGEAPAQEQKPNPDTPAQESEVLGDQFRFAGTVLNDRGQPVKGAAISFGYLHEKPDAGNPRVLATSDEQGKFQFVRQRSELTGDGGRSGLADAGLIATKDGYGFAIGAVQYFDNSGQLATELSERQRQMVEHEYGEKSTILMLVPDDVPIRGRVLNSEGQPVVGAKIELASIRQGTSGNLDVWETAVKQPMADDTTISGQHLRPLSTAGYSMTGDYPLAASHLLIIPPVRTGDDGSFTLKGLGRDRIVQLYVSGPGIATMPLHVRSRRGEARELIERRDMPSLGNVTYHPADFTCIVSPSIPVTGRVTDKGTNKPLAGYVVRGYKIATNAVHGGLEAMYIHTKTDTDGRYRLEGLPLGENIFHVAPPDGSPHLAANVEITTSIGSPPLIRDVALSTGVKARGRVTDSRTHKPIEGVVTYFAFETNPHLQEATGFDSPGHQYRSDADGRFEIPVLPGPGILGFRADNVVDYPRGVGAETIDGPKTVSNTIFFMTVPWRCAPDNFHIVASLNPPPDAAEVNLDLTLTPGDTFTVRVRTENGQPLSNYYVHGDNNYGPWNRHEAETFQVKCYFPTEGRRIIVYEPERNLVGYRDVTGDAAESIEIIVRPGGTFVGRIVDPDGLPAENHSIYSDWGNENRQTLYSPSVVKMRGPLTTYLDGFSKQADHTDKDGRFTLKGIIPGLAYTAGVSGPAKISGRQQMMGLGRIFSDVTAESGQTKDLGDLRINKGNNDGEKLDPKQQGATQNNALKGNASQVAAGTGPNVPELVNDTSFTFAGTTVDDRGQPIAGAKLFTPVMPRGKKHRSIYDARLTEKGQTDANGQFAILIASEEFEGIFRGASQPKQLPLLAYAPGRGAEWFDVSPDGETNDAKIVLRPERLIEGRLINSEGQPVVGAKVAAVRIFRPKDGDTLDAFLAAWKRQPNEAPWNAATHVTAQMPFANATSDQEGRFVIHGIALERIAELEFTAPNLVIPSLWIVNRDGFTASEHYQGPSTNRAVGAHMQLAERLFTQIGLPAYELSGRVTSEDGQPVANVRIMGNNGYHASISTETGADGRYKLSGLAHQKRIGVRFDAAPESGLLPHDAVVDHQGNESQKTLDLVLKKGVIIRGRVTDKATGKGVSAGLRFVPLPENDFVKRPDYTPSATGGQGFCNNTGNFELQVIPGPGVLMVSVARGQAGGQATIGGEVRETYRQARFSDEDRQRVKVRPEENGMQSFIRDGKHIEFILDHSAVQYVNAEAGKTPPPIEIQVDRGQTVDLEFVDSAGQPVPGVFVSGVTEMWPITAQLTDSTCTIYALSPDHPRHVVACHAARGLAGSATLKGDEKSPIRVQLVKTASLKGRAIDADGSPIAATNLIIDFTSHSIDELLRFQDLKQPKITTDDDGRFTIPGIVPGERFTIYTEVKGTFLHARLAKEQQSLTPGQQLDLGNVLFASRNQANSDEPSKKTASASPPPNPGAPAATDIISGLVLLSTNQPAKSTNVAVVAVPNKPRQGGELTRNGEVLAEGKTDDAGRFRLQLNGVSSTSHKYANLIARHDGSALAWQKLNLDTPETAATLKLEHEEPIRGRLIDLEGRPASNINLRIRSVMKRTTDEWYQEGIGFDAETLPAAWLAPLTTDHDGRFVIHGISSAHGVGLNVAGSDRFASQDILLNTGMAEQRGERDATYRSLVRNAKPSEEIVLPLSPSQIFEGTIRFDDTQEPVPHARITIWASQQRVGGSMTSVEGQTDAAGRYRIAPRPGIRFGVKAYPPNGAAYLVRETTDDIRWESGDRIKQVDLTLPAGILIHGKILTAGSKEPVAGASIQFIPQSSKSRAPPKGVVTGWQGIQVSGTDGNYQIAVPPVPGHLLVNHDNGNFILSEIGSRVLSSGKPGGQRQYSHAIQKIDPAPDAKSLDLTIELQPGAIASGRIVDPQGQPVDNTVVVSRLHIWSHWLTWHGNTERWPAAPGRFELKGLKEGIEYPTHFLDPKRRLGATVNLKAGDKEPTIVLEPCGSATARFLDDKGQPLADIHPNFDIIITPGVHRYDFEAQQAGQLAADSDLVANVDRTNHGVLKTDAEGKLTIPALIPGATYAVKNLDSRRWEYVKEFHVLPGQTLDLGDITQLPPPGQPKAAAAAPTRSASEGKVAFTSQPSNATEMPLPARPSANRQADGVLNSSLPPAAQSPGTAPSTASLSSRGRVLGADGKAIAEAKIYWIESRNPDPNPLSPRLLATSDAAGNFSFTLPPSSAGNLDEPLASTSQVRLVVIASGHGFVLTSPGELRGQAVAAARLNGNQPDDQIPTVRLPPAGETIRGKLVNIDGQPIAGVTVRIRWFDDATANRSFLGDGAASTNENTAWIDRVNFLMRVIEPVQLRDILPTATTDASGNFELRDLGENRIFHLLVQSDQAEAKSLVARNQPGEAITIPPDLGPRETELVLHPRDFVTALGPSQVTTGRVVDRDTGEPILGAVIRVYKTPAISHFSWSGSLKQFETKTDAQGRFQISGLTKGSNYRLVAFATGDVPYIPISRAADKSDDELTGLNFRLQRGLWATGRVYDTENNRPLIGEIKYFWFGDEKLEQDPGYYYAHVEALYRTNAKGEFRVPVLPTRGVLGFHFPWATPIQEGINRFPHSAGKESIDGHEKIGRLYPFPTLPTQMFASTFQRLVQISPQPGQTAIHVDLPLTPSPPIQVRVVDALGRPLAGCEVSGVDSGNWSLGQSSEFSILALPSDERRKVLVFHRQRNLAGGTIVKQGVAQPVEIKLVPAGSITGRLVDSDGEPITDGLLHVDYDKFTHQDTAGIWANAPNVRSNPTQVPTDDKGRFQLDGLVPGWNYSAYVNAPKRFIGKSVPTFRIGNAFTDVSVAPGEKKDLGDLTVQKEPSKPASNASKQASGARQPTEATTTTTATTVTLSGLVLLPDGKPAASATVRAAAPVWAAMKPVLGENFQSTMSEVKTDSAGRFTITFSKQPFGDLSKFDPQWQQMWKKTAIAASLNGYGPAWVAYESIETKQQPITFRLVEDLPIRGRVIDLEGRPIAGTTVIISEPQAAENEDLSAWLAGIKAGELGNTVWQKAPRNVESRLIGVPIAATTDAKGAFEVRGIGRERIIGLTFDGESVAHSYAKAVTRPMETLHKNIGLPGPATEPVFGAEFTYTAEPARTVEGIVLDAKTRQPLAGVAVESDKLANYPISNHRVLKTTTDKDGRFRLVGMPKGPGNRLILLPNDDQPYFMREVDVPDPVGLGPAQMEIELHRGIWIIGHITNKATGEPAASVKVQYFPFLNNEFAKRTPEFNPNGNVDGDQSRYQSQSDGSFRLVGLPGRAVIGAVSWWKSYRQGVGYDQIDAPKYDKTDWLLTYRNSIAPSSKFPNIMQEINPPEDATEFKVDLQLDPGAAVKIRVTDATGNPLMGVSVAGLTSLGYFETESNAVITAVNLGPQETRIVVLEKKESNLGRVLFIGPDEIRAGETIAQLQPCAKITGQVLLDDGTPFSGLAIEPRVLPFGDFGRQLQSVATDAEGRFQTTLLPGCKYNISGMGGSFQYVELAKELSVEPGQTLDLGTLKLNKDGKLTSWKP